MNIPLLKPEIITKETKLKQRKMNIEASNDFEIVLDKESLKQHMRNIWNEDNMINTIDSLSIIQNEPINFNGTNMTQIKKTTIEEYEEQIRQLKKALNKKETEIIEYSNKLKSLPTKNLEENIPTKEDINENYLNDLISNKWMKENLNLKNIELSILGNQKLKNENLRIQLIDSLYIKNYPNQDKIINYTKPSNNIIENNYNIEILPYEKEPLKKQLIDNLYIEGNDVFVNKEEREEIISVYRGKKILGNKFNKNKTQIEPRDNLEILPLEREPLRKQIVDSLYIEGFIPLKPENRIQNIDKLSIPRTMKPTNNIIQEGDSLEIIPLEKEPLKKQLVDDMYIEGTTSIKPENKIQNIDKLCIFRSPRPLNLIEPGENLEILPLEKEPLKKQLIDDLYIERIMSLKPENKIQNIDKLSIFRTPRPDNIIEEGDNLEIISIEKEKEPLKKQLVDDLYIERIMLLKPENKIQNIDKLSILRTMKPINNSIEEGESLEILPLEKDPLKKQLVDDLYIEGQILTKPDNKIQNIDKLSIFRTPRPDNIIEEGDNLEILKLKKEPLKKQLVDDLYIEKILLTKPENKIQNIDKLTILKNERPENIIEEKDNIEILPKEKEPLKSQVVDKLYVEGKKTLPIHKDLIVDTIDPIEVLKKEKEPLNSQVIDSLCIEGLERKENEIQNTSLMTILRTARPLNNIEAIEDLFIKAKEKEKEPLKKQLVDDLYIEKIIKPENNIQNIDKMEILRTPKKILNIVEERDNIHLLPKEKEPLKKQLVDDLLIEKNKKPENNIQNIDKVEILRTPKPEN